MITTQGPSAPKSSSVRRPTKSTPVPRLPSVYAFIQAAFYASAECTLRLFQNTRSLVAATLALSLAQTCSTAAQPFEVYSIADQIKAANDCSDQSNAECRHLFETTCTWAGDSAVTLRDGIAQRIPFNRIGERIVGELVEIAEGSGGYVDLELADSMIEPMGLYFLTGQYNADFAHFNEQAGMAFAMMLGAQITGSAKEGSANETMAETNKRRDELLRQKWFNTCMQTAYF